MVSGEKEVGVFVHKAGQLLLDHFIAACSHGNNLILRMFLGKLDSESFNQFVN